MTNSTSHKILVACNVLVAVTFATLGCKTTQQHTSKTELASTEEPLPTQSESQSRPFAIMTAQHEDEMGCMYAIVAQVLQANFKDPLTIDSRYGWRPGLTDARKYWFTVHSGNGTAYTLNMRAKRDAAGYCHVDLESINPLYMENSAGETVMSIQGNYSNSLFKTLNQGGHAVVWAMFWVATEAKDALRPAPRAPSSRVGSGL